MGKGRRTRRGVLRPFYINWQVFHKKSRVIHIFST
nr:MAG TPA: hypothetical protein [Caudoviricetes sp.]